MKLYYNINEKNRIIEYSTVYNAVMQELETEVEINNSNYKEYKVIEGELIHSPIPSKPIDLYNPILDENDEWVEGATLEESQLIKREELKKERDLSTIQPYEYKGVMHQADLISQDKFFKSLLLNETDIHWIALDNTTHLLTHEDFELIVNGLKEREKQSFVKFNTLYIQVLLCETIDEIKDIIW